MVERAKWNSTTKVFWDTLKCSLRYRTVSQGCSSHPVDNIAVSVFGGNSIEKGGKSFHFTLPRNCDYLFHIKMNSWISWESGLDAQQRRPKAENVKTSLLCYQGPTKVNKQYTYVVLLIVDKQYTYCCSVDKRYCRQYSWYRQYSQQTIYIVLLSWQYLIFANLAIWLHLLPPNVKGKRYWTLSFPFLAKEKFPQWSLGDVE